MPVQGGVVRALIFIFVLLLPSLAVAQSTSSAATPSNVAAISQPAAAGAAPTSAAGAAPTFAASAWSGYHVAAIALGAASGVVIAHIVTYGVITPILVGTGPGTAVVVLVAGGSAHEAFSTALGVVGGVVGNWVYWAYYGNK
jgi:hypothetical protein